MGRNRFLHDGASPEKQCTAYWRSPKQEKAVARKLKGKRINGSGSGRKKGDVYIEGVLRVECKTTQKKSFSITKDMLEKIHHAGIGSGELPVIVVEFINNSGKPTDEVAVLPMWALELLLDKARDTDVKSG